MTRRRRAQVRPVKEKLGLSIDFSKFRSFSENEIYTYCQKIFSYSPLTLTLSPQGERG